MKPNHIANAGEAGARFYSALTGIAPPRNDNATTGNRGAEAKQNSGHNDYTATIMTPLDVALERNPVDAAMLEVLGRIAAALELHNRLLEGQQDATWSVSNRLEDMMRYMGGGL